MGFFGVLGAIGHVAKEVGEAKLNKKLGTHFGSGTSKPAPGMTTMSQVAPEQGSSPRRNSARSGTASEYSGIGTPGALDN